MMAGMTERRMSASSWRTMLSAARAHNLSNLMGDPILSSGLRRTAGKCATGSNTALPSARRGSVRQGRSFGEAPLDEFEQDCGFERLSHKGERAGRERLLVQVVVRQGCDEDNGRCTILSAKSPNEIEPAHPGHMNIGDDAIENGKIRRGQKALCGREWFSSMANGVYEIHQAQAKLFVIVNDRDERTTHQTRPWDI
jgi:hypothetical protein